MRKMMIIKPRMISPSEAAAWGATATASIGPTITTSSSSSLRATTPKITQVVLPIPPTISMPRYQTEFMKGNWSTVAKAT
jgi:hypothetical protein